VNSDTPLFTIQQMVYADGWKQCGFVTVLRSGSYTWIREDIWNRDATNQIYVGQLPPNVFNSLQSFCRKLSQNATQTNTVATYVQHIDDTIQKPEAIQSILDFLSTTHPMTASSGSRLQDR
jgi:hypothetical protein